MDKRSIILENGNPAVDLHQTAEEMDEIRQKNIAYQYLCHLEEAKKWLEVCLKEDLPPTTELEEYLRNGVYLAKLGNFISPETVCLIKIFDLEQKRFKVSGLQFRHTDNISYWLKSLASVGLPLTFHPETTDVYDKKNMPRVIYCLHALSTHLFKLGKAPLMQDLYGKVNFTDDEINAVCKELEKYGIQMPPFQKIGGILTNDLAGDKAQLHAAVIAVNETVDRKDSNETMKTLFNPIVDFQHLSKNLSAEYQDALYVAKRNKSISAHNRSLSESYVSDAYDELLTHAEIQGHISYVNFFCNWNKLIESAEKRQYELFKHCLKAPFLHIKEIKDGLITQYCEYLCDNLSEQNLNNNMIFSESQCFLQNIVSNCNRIYKSDKAKEHAVRLLNDSLDSGNCWDTLQSLKCDVLNIEGIDDFAAPLYYEEMKNDRSDSGADIGLLEIQACVRVLSLVSNVTKMVDTKSSDDTWIALSHPDLHIKELESFMKSEYWKALYECRQLKISNGSKCPLLTYMDVQDCVYLVNLQCEENRLKIDSLNKINAAVIANDKGGLLKALKNPSMEVVGSQDVLVALYMKLLKELVTKKQSNEGTELWLDDVYAAIDKANCEANEMEKVYKLLWHINFGIEKNEENSCLSKLTNGLLNENLYDKLKPIYYRRLQEYKHKRESQYHYPWITHCSNEGNVAFINLESGDILWEPPEGFKYGSNFLNVKEIKNVIAYVNKKYITSNEDKKKIDDALIQFQACARGFLVRQKHLTRLVELKKRNTEARKIQAWWRRILLNRTGKGTQATKSSTTDYHQKEKEEKVVKIQALWRGYQARQAFLSLVHQPNPDMKVVRHFAPLLSWNSDDYQKEIKLQTLKGEVVQNIRHSQLLSQQLDGMDIKIGLLVQNRITLQDVVAHGTTMNDLAKGAKKRDGGSKNTPEVPFGMGTTCKGLKSLTKESRKLLEGYQHLFYLLQTKPSYLSKLIFCLPQSKTTKFLQTVILTLYNFGSNAREEYLLLKLFKSALEEEVKWKIQKVSDTVTGNPLVLKLVVRYARQHSGQNCLHAIVGPLIEKILNDKSMVMDTNPVEIYKSWINQIETETGKPSGLPYAVTQEKALSFEEVQRRLSNGIKTLKEATLMFLNCIVQSKDQLPYGLLYIAKVLKNSLATKFPSAPEKDLLKVIGNFIYYQFINSAIVAPDAFDIISLPADKTLSNDRRRNLASIAKILQFSASKKGFGEESKHLTCLNPFIIECHEKFKKFFRLCCEIEEPEDHFSIHEFSEATLISRPAIYITFQEICDTHSLLMDYQEQIAPDPMDPIHEILEDLGSKPCVGALVGAAYPEGPSGKAANTTFHLMLANKFEVPDDDVTDAHKIFIQTKELLVSALPFLFGRNLSEALTLPSTDLQAQKFEEFQCCRLSHLKEQHKLLSNSFSMENVRLSLEECKLQIRRHLNKLELEGFVSQDNHYQTILTAIARDICNRRKYRQIRLKELQTLRSTKNSLDMKIQFYEEQVNYYNQYIKKCLENLNAGKRSVHSLKSLTKQPGKIKSKIGIKYTADKLSAKGIILEIEGLPKSQFKNVLFEIVPTEGNGVFEVKGKFMGVEMEKMEINIQNLLQLQFEGVSIMDIFGKAKLNINLLLFLLNKKFYGKN